MKSTGKQMSLKRKIEIVRSVLSKSKGLSMLSGEKLVLYVAKSINIYELPCNDGRNTKDPNKEHNAPANLR